jgi:hypothetical protein
VKRLKLGNTLRNLLVDGAIFAGFLLATDPRATGQAVHEWLGIAFAAGIITHLLLHWKWVVNVVRRFFTRLPGQVRINSLLNSLLFVDVVLIIFSGLMISKVVLSTFGLTGQHDGIWRTVHGSATNIAVLLMGLHVALHWKWVVNAAKRYLWQPLCKNSVISSRATRIPRAAARNLPQAQKIPAMSSAKRWWLARRHPFWIRNDTTTSVNEQGGAR